MTVSENSAILKFNTKSSFGGKIGLEKKHYLTRIQYGGIIGYWNDYLTYNLYFRAFIWKEPSGLLENMRGLMTPIF